MEVRYLELEGKPYVRQEKLGFYTNAYLFKGVFSLDVAEAPGQLVVKGSPYGTCAQINRYWEELEIARDIRKGLAETMDDDLAEILKLDLKEKIVIYRYIEGNDFSDEMRRLLQQDELDEVMCQFRSSIMEILEIIFRLNGEGVIHRDVKPMNIVSGVRKRLIDLDYMTYYDDNYKNKPKGTTRYMSLPVFRELDRHKLRDLYAMGVTVLDFLNKLFIFPSWPKDSGNNPHDFALHVAALDQKLLLAEIKAMMGEQWEEYAGMAEWGVKAIKNDPALFNRWEDSKELFASGCSNLITY